MSISFILRRSCLVLLLAVAGVMIESLLAARLPSLSMLIPNIPLIIVVYLGFHDVTTLGVVLTFLIGILADLSTGYVLGRWAAGFLLVFGIIAALSQRLFVESTFAVIFVSGVGVLLANVVYAALGVDSIPDSGRVAVSVLGEVVATAAVAPLFFRGLRAVLDRKPRLGSRSMGARR